MKRTRARAVRRGLLAVAVTVVSSFLISACAPANTAGTGGNSSVNAALAKEGEVQFAGNANLGWNMQAVLLTEVINELGGKAKTVNIPEVAATMTEMAKSDNLVSLEVWKWQQLEYWKKYVQDAKSIEEIGENSLTAEEGWYVPTYVIKGDPARGIQPMCPGLPDYKALNDCKDVFKTAATGSQGQYMTGAEAWATYYKDDGRVKGLGLDYKIAYAGSEAALNAEWAKAFQRGAPLLALAWKPSYVGMKYDITRIDFPKYTDECWNNDGACQWPDTTLYKIASADFSKNHPEALKIVKNYDLSDADYIKIMSSVLDDGMTTEDAVTKWMQDNQSVWQKWAA